MILCFFFIIFNKKKSNFGSSQDFSFPSASCVHKISSNLACKDFFLIYRKIVNFCGSVQKINHLKEAPQSKASQLISAATIILGQLNESCLELVLQEEEIIGSGDGDDVFRGMPSGM